MAMRFTPSMNMLACWHHRVTGAPTIDFSPPASRNHCRSDNQHKWFGFGMNHRHLTTQVVNELRTIDLLDRETRLPPHSTRGLRQTKWAPSTEHTPSPNGRRVMFCAPAFFIHAGCPGCPMRILKKSRSAGHRNA